MKQIIFLFTFMLLSNFVVAQYATVKYINSTSTYYAGVFFTTAVNGSCPTATLDTFYHDIPDGHTYSREVSSESGNFVTNITDVSGIALKDWYGGTVSHTIPFCYAGTPMSSFVAVIPEPGSVNPLFTFVEWTIDSVNNIVYIKIY